MHGMQIKISFIQLLFCVACTMLENCHDRKWIQNDPARHMLKRVISRLYTVCNFSYWEGNHRL